MTDIDREGNEVELVPFADIDEEDDETDWDDEIDWEYEEEDEDDELVDAWLHDEIWDDEEED